MTLDAPSSSRSRIARAIALFAGAALLGPALPALAFAAMAEIGGRLEGPHERLALSFPSILAAALSFAFTRGGGVTAAGSGAALAAIVLVRGKVDALITSVTVALIALAVAAWSDRHGPRHEAPFLVLAFVFVAVATANILYRVAVHTRLSPKE
ncbi:MAG TPA: hypothetical protein VMU56_01265 [Beijerinckiaceae bacterium]|nr:hypothetical protein [Beijerinckiaceae bacterium]HVB88622.1 hypothetical protein [Beijerinckiaceae bacterium]